MPKVLFFLAALGCVLMATVGVACGGANPDGGGINLPPRDDSGSADSSSTTPVTDGASASCTGLTTKVSDRPACDTCAKQQCCTEIQACNASADCKALQDCLAPCAQTDIVCVLTCQESHSKGNDVLSDVGSCAGDKCKTECPADTPDADPFADSGL